MVETDHACFAAQSLIESVSNLVKQHRKVFDSWMDRLGELENYNIHWDLVRTQDHGIPHRRVRLYIVGIRKDVQKQPFKFPEAVPCLPLDLFLEGHSGSAGWLKILPNTNKTHKANVSRGLEEMIDKNYDPRSTPAIIDHGATRGAVTYFAAPTLTACRMGAGGFWLLHKGRQMTYTEMLRLQGLPPSRFKPLTSKSQAKMQHAVGNAMSGNVVHRMVARIAWPMGYTDVRDAWADPLEACLSLA